MPTKILAIDDSKTMRLAIKITFAAEDAEVVAVSKGSEAVARAKQMGADIVLVDHRLAPGEPSGFDVCKALASDPATAKIPVLLLTKGPPDEATSQRIAACGAAGFVAKPFGTQELIDKVRAVVGGKAPRPAAGAPKPVPRAPQAPAAGPKVAPPPPVRTPAAAPKPAARPAAAPKPAPRPAAAKPAARPAAAPKPAPRPAASAPQPGAGGGEIPIAVPIPFVAADAPTPGIVERLAKAQGAAAGLDPKVAEALVALSREVVEKVVWEVVPELAEAMIAKAQRSG